jgi:hypothetical protein
MEQLRGDGPAPRGEAASADVARAGSRWRRRVALVAGASHLLAGCYSYVPVASGPTPGRPAGFEISDAGRVALGDRLGPGVTRVEGQVTEATPDEYVVAVRSISQINGGRTAWSGEPVHLRREYVSRTEERKLSRGRTALAIGVAAGAFVAALLTRSLIGGSGGVREGGNNGGNGDS